MLEDVDAPPITAVDMVAPEVKRISSYELYMNRWRLKYQRSKTCSPLKFANEDVGDPVRRRGE